MNTEIENSPDPRSWMLNRVQHDEEGCRGAFIRGCFARG